MFSQMLAKSLVLAAIVHCIGTFARSAQADVYDPLQVKSVEGKPSDFLIEDAGRSRKIPIRVYLPATKAPAPVVLFSHGLGGSREGSPYLGKHWSARGFVVVFVQHPGSDDSVWKDTPLRERMAAMKKAASAENFQLRAKDIPAVLDQLTEWNESKDHALAARMELKKVGMSGHSFGAVTTQAVSGQTVANRAIFTDKRILAACAMSPSTPARGTAKEAFGAVKIPWLLMTGTKDTSPIGNTTVESRLAVYPALPQGDKYELVLHNAEHSAFTDRALPGEKGKRNPNHHRAILATSTAFWEAYLNDDQDAKTWLNSDAVGKVFEKEDRWQKK